MSRGPWRNRCPHGHTSLYHASGDYYLCQSCDRYFSSPTVDAREVDGFPIPDASDRLIGESPPDRETKANERAPY